MPRLLTGGVSDMRTSRAVPSPAYLLQGGLPVPSPAEHLRDLAAECRHIAAASHDETIRQELILTAERFERLARVREQAKAKVRSN